ncbi:unnamed protein product [Rotaria magnacalcarata]|uniref:Uncharacterized protein n=1 Tax=Rotaria magnacalcarata TaxID=392030 RepID=A0A816LN10_9BILA|nr:unnamed protein product [Rotaria magnacalcarata]
MRFALIVSNAAVARPALRLNAQNFHMGDTTLNYVFYKPSDYYNQLKKSLQLIQQNARDQSNYSHMNNKKYYDRNRSNPHYDINDTILIRIHGLRSKLDPQFTLTPKIAIQKQHPTYWVRDQMNDQITRVHVNDMRPILLPLSTGYSAWYRFDRTLSVHQTLATREPPKSRHTCRSLPSRIRRNYRRNAVKRSYRDRHCILRLVYHRFKLYQLKHILRQRNVRYVHLKLDKSSQVLSIGMKRSSLVDLYFDRLPGDLFDKKHYYQHRQHQHRYY